MQIRLSHSLSTFMKTPSDKPNLFQPLQTSIHQVRSIQTSADTYSTQPFTVKLHIRLSHSLSSFMKTPSVLISTKRQKSKVMPYRPIELLGTHTTMSYAFLSFYFIVWPPSDNPTLFQPLRTSIHQVRSIQTSVDADSAQPFTGKLHEDPFVLISTKRQNSTAMP